ncbi:hypothetical protein CF642_38905 [Burkholderia pseudomallei]|nr:hypothetical protein CF642_38905 [Burkholderia pseudomallei]
MDAAVTHGLSNLQRLVAVLVQIPGGFTVTGDIDDLLRGVCADLKGRSTFLRDTLMRIPVVSVVHSSVGLDEIKCTSAMRL